MSKLALIYDEEMAQELLDMLEACKAELAATRLLLETKEPEREELLTPDEAAALLKVSKTTLWNWSKKGIIKSKHLGNQVRFLRSNIIAAATPSVLKKGR